MHPPTLRLHTGSDFHRRAWPVQPMGWLLLAAVALAVLLWGVFGKGVLSDTTRGDGNGLVVEYDRFARADARTTLDLYVDASAATQTPGMRELRVARDWLDGVRLHSIVPPPREAQADARTVRYRFDVQDGDPLHVRIEAEPVAAGRLDLRVSQPDEAPIRMTQHAFP